MAVKTFSVGEVVSSADANTYLANAGLDYINVTTASASTTKIVSGFSNTWENYRLVVSNLTATSGTLVVQMSLSGTGAATNYYSGLAGITYAGVAANATVNNGVWWTLGAPSSTIGGTVVMDIIRPNVAAATSMTVTHTAGDRALAGGGYHTTATAYNELVFALFSGGTFSGTFRLYGYRQA